MLLADFCAHADAVAAGLEEMNVLALRLYTTAAFRSINNPLRDMERYETNIAHKLPVTVALISEAVGMLRSPAADTEAGRRPMDLYRGMRDVALPPEFMERGGTELVRRISFDPFAVPVRVLWCCRADVSVVRLLGADVDHL